MTIIGLALLGLCLGSFANAVVWRLYQQKLPAKRRKAGLGELSIIHGRSMCVHCGHTLTAWDLLPVVSWFSLHGKCRYCKESISWQYPAVELVTALLFVISYLYWPLRLEGWNIVHFGCWLVCLVGLMTLIVYDLRWTILPNRIIFPLYGVAAIAITAQILDYQTLEPLRSAAVGVLIGGGIFYLLFQISKGTWIGGGDVKLGFLLGALIGGPIQAFMMLFFASLLGTLTVLPLMASRKVSSRTRIPFGPFLIAAAIFVQLFGPQILDWYLAYLV